MSRLISCWVTSTPLACPISDSSSPQADPPLGDLAVVVALALHLGARRGRIGLVGRLMLQLTPDLVELGIDHRRRHIEIVAPRKLVEQLALHVGAGEAVMLLLDLPLEQPAQLLQALESQVLRQLLVDRRLAGGLHRLDGDVEGRGLARQLLDRILRREGDVQHLRVADLGPDQLVLEPRDQAPGTELHRHVGARAALERHAVRRLAEEIDHDLIAHRRRVTLVRVAPALLGVGELPDLLVDRLVPDRHDQPLELEAVDRRGRHFGQHF